MKILKFIILAFYLVPICQIVAQNKMQNGIQITSKDTISFYFDPKSALNSKGNFLVQKLIDGKYEEIRPEEAQVVYLVNTRYVAKNVNGEFMFLKMLVGMGEAQLYQGIGKSDKDFYLYMGNNAIDMVDTSPKIREYLQEKFALGKENTKKIISKIILPQTKLYMADYLSTLVLNYNSEIDSEKFEYNETKIEYKPFHKLSAGLVMSGFSISYAYEKAVHENIRFNVGLEYLCFKSFVDNPNEIGFKNIPYKLKTFAIPIGMSYVAKPSERFRTALNIGVGAYMSSYTIQTSFLAYNGIEENEHDIKDIVVTPRLGGYLEFDKYFLQLDIINANKIYTLNVKMGILL